MFYIDVVLIPVLVGALFRLIFIKKEKGYFATLLVLAVTLVLGGYALYLYNFGHSGGNEGPGLLAWASACSLVGACLVEGIRKLIKMY